MYDQTNKQLVVGSGQLLNFFKRSKSWEVMNGAHAAPERQPPAQGPPDDIGWLIGSKCSESIRQLSPRALVNSPINLPCAPDNNRFK